METVTVAVITGIFSVISAAVSALVAKNGIGFWRSGTRIDLKGTGKELIEFGSDGSRTETEGPFTYELRDGYLKMRGDRIAVKAHLCMRSEDGSVVEGRVSGSGPLVNGYGYLTYKVKDGPKNQSWKGLLLLRVPGFGNMTGYWLTEDNVKAGAIALGETTLERV